MKVAEGQSVMDVAVKECGSLEAAYDLAKLNNISLTDELETGKELQTTDAVEVPIVNYYKNNDLNPATAAFPGDEIDNDRIFGTEFPQEFE